MGADVEIYFRTTDGEDPILDRSVPNGLEIVKYTAPRAGGPTHFISTLTRYYGIGYERGPWVYICALLMMLHACETVDKVWYNSDYSEERHECTPEEVLKISAHYMKNGERPYRSRHD